MFGFETKFAKKLTNKKLKHKNIVAKKLKILFIVK